MPRQNAYDWKKWSDAYITGTMSLAELSQEPGAPAWKTMRNRCHQDDWVGQRKRYQDIVARKLAAVPEIETANDKLDKIIDAAEMITRHLRLAKMLGAKAAQAIALTDPKDLKPSEALAWARAAIEVERLVEGLVTQRQQIDLSRLSDEDLEKLVAY